MKIGFIGTGGTGKTTTQNVLKGFLSEKPIESVARSVFREFGLTEEVQRRMDVSERWRIQKTIFDRKIEQDHQNQDGLFERTLLDTLAYCLLRCDEAIADSMLKSMMIIAQENMRKYDLLFYFPMYEWIAPPDGFREDKFSVRLAHDLLLRGLIHTLELDVLVVPNNVPYERAAFIMKEVERKRMQLEIELGRAVP